MLSFLETQKGRFIADRVEQVLLVVTFVWLCSNFLTDGFPPKSLITQLLLISEGAVVLFVLMRRQTADISIRPMDWLVALGGTYGVMMVQPSDTMFMPELGAALMVFGIFLHIGAKMSLRRSFGIVAADRGIKSTGMYRFVRHPMYFGYLVVHIGFVLASPSVWNIAVYALSWGCLTARIFAEERVLSQNPEYVAYKQKVRYRLLPALF